jgi:hypothetical protein
LPKAHLPILEAILSTELQVFTIDIIYFAAALSDSNIFNNFPSKEYCLISLGLDLFFLFSISILLLFNIFLIVSILQPIF